MADHRLRMRGSEVSFVPGRGGPSWQAAGIDALGAAGRADRRPASPGIRQCAGSAVAKDLQRSRGEPGHRGAAPAGRGSRDRRTRSTSRSATSATPSATRAPLPTDATAGAGAAAARWSQDIAAGARRHAGHHRVEPGLRRARRLQARRSCSSACPNSIYHGALRGRDRRRVPDFVPAAHALESWGDVRAVDGTVSIIQPLIAPLWSDITEADVLGRLRRRGHAARTSC